MEGTNTPHGVLPVAGLHFLESRVVASLELTTETSFFVSHVAGRLVLEPVLWRWLAA